MKINKRKLVSLVSSLLVFVLVLGVLLRLLADPVHAWFDDSYAYRQRITFTHNASISAERAITFSLDTAELIAAGVMQADCDDTRFTNINGLVLKFQLTGACNNAATTYEVVFPEIFNGTNVGYVYYGNPSAVSASQDVSGVTVLTPSGGDPAITTRTNEEKGPGPIAHWKFDEGYGTATRDATANNNTGTISGSTWQTEDTCVFGKCLWFDGSDDQVAVSNTVSGVQTVSFWVRPNAFTSTTPLIDLNGTAKITANSSGVISAGGFTAPTIYVNGQPGTTLVANRWQYVSVTTGTGISASAIKMGSDGTNFQKGFLDDVKFYNYPRTADQIKADFAGPGTPEGASASFSPDRKWLSDGLVGYWKMDESSGNAADSSGNATTLTNNGTSTFTAGKFWYGSEHVPASSQHFSTATTINGVKSVSFWTNPDSASNYYISLTSSAYITSSSGALSATGFTNPRIFVNGVETTTIAADIWQLVTVTSETAINANQFYVGRQDVNYYDGTLDEIRLYNRALTPDEVRQLHNWAPGPVGYWKMDEGTGSTAFDSSINQNHFSDNITPGSGRWATGKFGSGYSFDSADTVISAGSGSSLDNLPATGMTISAWIYPTSMGESSLGFIMAKNSGTAPSDGWILRLANTNALTFTVDGSTDLVRTSSNNVVTLNTWNHVAVYWDGVITTASSVRILVNGSEVSYATTTNGASRVDDDSSNFLIGNDSTSARTFAGTIDDVKVYNYARTPAQIIEDMNAGHPIGGSPIASQYAYWKFDEQSGQTTNNSGTAGSTHNGTLGANSSVSTDDPAWKIAGAQECRVNGCLSFDGGDFVSLDNPSNLNFSAPATVTSWVKTSSDTNQTLFSISEQTTINNYLYVIIGGNPVDACSDELINVFRISGGTTTYSLCYTSTNRSELIDGNWHHVAVTFDGSQVRIYLDGKEKSVTVGQGTNNGAFGGLGGTINAGRIGTLRTSSSNFSFFNGGIDDLKIYNSALSASEILIDMNAGSNAAMGGVLGTQNNEGFGLLTPAGWWKMDENTGTTTTDDSSGNGKAMTMTSMTNSNWVPGKTGSSLNFNGSTQYLNNATSILGITNLTITAWIKPRVSHTGTIYMQGRTTADSPYFQFTYVGGSGGVVTFASRNDSGTEQDASNASSDGATAGQWNFVAMTKSSGNIAYYVNGVKSTATVATAGTYNNMAHSVIGMLRRNTNIQFFDGDIDDVQVYSSTLTDTQIAYIYNRGAPFAWYKFDECQDTTAYNSAPTASGGAAGNNGTITIGGSGSYTSAGSCGSDTSTHAWNAGTIGKFNASLGFDGTNDYVSLASPSDFNISSPLTISAWVKSTTTSNQVYFNISQATSLNNWAYIAIGTNSESSCTNELVVINRVSSGSTTYVQCYETSNPNEVLDGNWHHLVFTFDGSSTKFYLDGIQKTLRVGEGSDTGSFGGIATVTSADIGRLAANSSSFSLFNGQIDDLRLYRYALSSDQIKKIMLGGSAGSAVRYGPETGSP